MEALDAVGAPELREALLYVRSRGCVCAGELAAAQDVHPNVARGRLARLAEAGLLVSRLERRSGRRGPGAGRPARLYSPAPELAAIEFPPRRYEELIGLLADAVPDRALEQTGGAFAGRLLAEAPLEPAADLPRALEQVCDALGRLGFHAHVEDADAQSGIVETPTCPLRPLVVGCAGATGIDRGLWSGLVAAALPGADVRCEPRGCLDGGACCRIAVRLTDRGSSDPPPRA